MIPGASHDSGIASFLKRYRDFIFEPGTLFTLASGLLLIAAMILYPGGIFSESGMEGNGKYLYLLAALVGSSYIWWSAVQGIREHDFTADIPVSIATIAAIAIGQYSAAAVVAVLLLLGGLLEDFVAARAGKALEALAKLLPDRVTVRRDGQDVVIPIEGVRAGDIVLVRSGERLAVDGTVISGSASVNQAAITGESLFVDKCAGDTVFAGTLNEIGVLEVRATKVGHETTLGQIHRLIAEAQEQKPPIERLLNRYAKLYTPIALLLGVVLWWWSGDVMRAITVLIVFCPCVMVLATPTALVASIGNAALRGSLVKKGATIEAMSRVDTIVFDKTGTLTLGQPRLIEIIAVSGTSRDDLLHTAAIAEKFSEHPLGRAVVREAREKEMAIPDPVSFTVLPGLGVRAVVNGRDVFVGRMSALGGYGISVPAQAENAVAGQAALGRNIIVLATDGNVSGVFAFEDELREGAKESIENLGRMGLRTVLLTGDNRPAAESVAGKLMIKEVYAEVLPQDKVEIVRRLQREGRKVAFVGDGVNDGPALAAADVGVAMGITGTDVAIETAEVGLLSDDLSRLPHLLAISRRAIRTIKQNVAFSLAVLSLAVLFTIPGILSPVTGALLHELSSIPVIINSARLIMFESKK
ncbi:MAG TPA: cation-translocating P-type ATPase [Methanocella sp.]|jgi:Cd2+/Zn2+-exporting ATPase